MTTTEHTDLTDLGPAPSAPSWCLPGTEPNTDSPVGDGYLWSWYRNFGREVWIETHDRIIDGRIVRSAPSVQHGDAPKTGWTAEEAAELGRSLILAAVVLDESITR